MKKTIKIMFITFIIVTTLTVAVSCSSQQSNATNKEDDTDIITGFAKASKEFVEKYEGKVIALVDGVGISRFRYENLKYVYKEIKKDANLTDKEILFKLIRNQVIINKATELKLLIDYNKVAEIVKENDKLLSERVSKKDENAILVYDALMKYVNELGLTLNEYNEKYTIPKLQESMTIKALFEHYKSNYQYKLKTTEETIKEDYERYIMALIKESEVIVFED